MKITNSTRHRMKELGLTTLRQWVFHKFMFNNVSFTQEDVNSQSGEKVYAKFARAFAKFEEETNIWKNPKVELPKDNVPFVYKTEKTIGTGVIKDGKFFTHGIPFDKLELYWCYEEDLIKQSKGEEDDNN